MFNSELFVHQGIYTVFHTTPKVQFHISELFLPSFASCPHPPWSGWASVIASNAEPMFRPTARPFVKVSTVVAPAPVTEPKAKATAGKPGWVLIWRFPHMEDTP